jgi:uncharacterized protein (DUF433 family)
MTDAELLARISSDTAIMLGKPVIRGTRLTVEHMLNLLAHQDARSVIAEYDGLTEDDIRACFLFAARELGRTRTTVGTR